MIEWILNHGEILLALLIFAEKLVKLSKSKWDDIIIDGSKYLLTLIAKTFSRL